MVASGYTIALVNEKNHLVFAIHYVGGPLYFADFRSKVNWVAPFIDELAWLLPSDIMDFITIKLWNNYSLEAEFSSDLALTISTDYDNVRNVENQKQEENYIVYGETSNGNRIPIMRKDDLFEMQPVFERKTYRNTFVLEPEERSKLKLFDQLSMKSQLANIQFFKSQVYLDEISINKFQSNLVKGTLTVGNDVGNVEYDGIVDIEACGSELKAKSQEQEQNVVAISGKTSVIRYNGDNRSSTVIGMSQINFIRYIVFGLVGGLIAFLFKILERKYFSRSD